MMERCVKNTMSEPSFTSRMREWEWRSLLMAVLALGLWALRQLLPAGTHPIAILASGGALCALVLSLLWFLLPRFFGEEGNWVRTQLKSRLPKAFRGSRQ